MITEDLVPMRDSWENNARYDGDRWVFNRLDCIEYLKSDCGWTHKKAVQEMHASNKGLFSRLRDNGFILKPEPVVDAPKKGKMPNRRTTFGQSAVRSRNIWDFSVMTYDF